MRIVIFAVVAVFIVGICGFIGVPRIWRGQPLQTDSIVCASLQSEWAARQATAEPAERAAFFRRVPPICKRLQIAVAAGTPGARFRECDACPQMVVVPSGEFRMGSPDDEAGRNADEGPQRTLRVANPFAVAQHEVTVAQYAQFARAAVPSGEGGCQAGGDDDRKLDGDASWRRPGFSQSERHPVVCVSWGDAHAYVAWLNGQVYRPDPVTRWVARLRDWGEGRSDIVGRAVALAGNVLARLLPDGGRTGPYRLLSEAEWEYAARARREGSIDTSRRLRALCREANYASAAVETEDGVVSCPDLRRYTAAVETFDANAFGLYDMQGNAWEWVEDCYSTTLLSIPDDGGAARSRPHCSPRVYRGASWGDDHTRLRFANRSAGSPDLRSNRIGFRVARDL